ncbi:hypothetical protein Tco_0212916 [Tanacetum coccineum]
MDESYLTMEEYMSKTQGDYGSGVTRPKIHAKYHFELKGQFLKELRDNTFSGSDHENANERIEKVLYSVDLFHISNITVDRIMLRAFPMSLTRAARRRIRNEPSGSIIILEAFKTKFLSKQILDSKGAIPTKTVANAKIAILEMAEYSQKWHNKTSKSRSTDTSDGLATIQAHLKNLRREIKKVNEKVQRTFLTAFKLKVVVPKLGSNAFTCKVIVTLDKSKLTMRETLLRCFTKGYAESYL